MLNRRVWNVAHQRQSWQSGNAADKKTEKKKGREQRDEEDDTAG